MSARFRSTAAGKPFLQPLDLHVEPADLLEELGLPDQGVVVVATATIAEEGLGAVDELLLPLTDLDGVDPVRLGELGEGLVLLGGLDGDLGLEGSRMAFLCAGHDAPRDGTVTFDQFNIPSGPFLGVHYRRRALGAKGKCDTPGRQVYVAAVHVLADLVKQGWAVRL